MLATKAGSSAVVAGLHFQLPPTIGRRDMKRRADRVMDMERNMMLGDCLQIAQSKV